MRYDSVAFFACCRLSFWFMLGYHLVAWLINASHRQNTVHTKLSYAPKKPVRFFSPPSLPFVVIHPTPSDLNHKRSLSIAEIYSVRWLHATCKRDKWTSYVFEVWGRREWGVTGDGCTWHDGRKKRTSFLLSCRRPCIKVCACGTHLVYSRWWLCIWIEKTAIKILQLCASVYVEIVCVACPMYPYCVYGMDPYLCYTHTHTRIECLQSLAQIFLLRSR